MKKARQIETCIDTRVHQNLSDTSLQMQDQVLRRREPKK